MGSFRSQPPEVRTLFGFSEWDVRKGRVLVAEDAVEAMDERYLIADEGGDLTLASHLFSTARLLEAMVHLQAKEDPDELCEAAYEALSASPSLS